MLEPFGLATRHPDEFLTDLFGPSAQAFIQSVRGDFHHYLTPKLQFDHYVESLRQAGVPNAAVLIDGLRVLIEPEENS